MGLMFTDQELPPDPPAPPPTNEALYHKRVNRLLILYEDEAPRTLIAREGILIAFAACGGSKWKALMLLLELAHWWPRSRF